MIYSKKLLCLLSNNCRLFAIVLSKLLVYGKDVDQWNLYDWTNDTINISTLQCDIPLYLDLIQFCYKGKINAIFAAAFVRSLYAQKYGILPETKKLENIPKTLRKLASNPVKTINSLFSFNMDDDSVVKLLDNLGQQ